MALFLKMNKLAKKMLIDLKIFNTKTTKKKNVKKLNKGGKQLKISTACCLKIKKTLKSKCNYYHNFAKN